MIPEDPDLDVDEGFLNRWNHHATILASVIAPDDQERLATARSILLYRIRSPLRGSGGMPYHLRRTFIANVVDHGLRAAKEHGERVFWSFVIWGW